MDRRTFVRLLTAVPLVTPRDRHDIPRVRVVSGYGAAATPGMPGRYPGTVVAVRSERCVDAVTSADGRRGRARDDGAGHVRADRRTSTPADAWRRFFEPADVVGIKVNCGGHPACVSDHEIVAETSRQLMSVGDPAAQIYVYERFQNQLDDVNYAPHLARGRADRRRRAREPATPTTAATIPPPTSRPTSSARRTPGRT